MQTARYSVRSRVAELVRILPCVLLLLVRSQVAAQEPVLRIGGAASTVIQGANLDGAAAFPARALETLGFRVADAAAGLTAILGPDTLHFWDTSPFFRSNGRVHQLAFAAREHAGAMHLPEQFFIQWLPATYPDRFQYSDGSLNRRGDERRTAVARAPATRVVVIDPGHGGRDPGRIGPGGIREKDVTLSISKRLASMLTERGYEVHLTRTTDAYVSLPERPRLANDWKGDRPVAVFLSIHANAARAASAHGFETFFLSDARTADERRVAEMENESIRFDDHAPAMEEQGLNQILGTLRSDFLMRASHDLAAVVQENIATFHPGPNRGVKRAGFHVLIGTIMPAVLIETAFISNRDEARLLASTSFQQKVARGIANSVDEFFMANEHLWETGH